MKAPRKLALLAFSALLPTALADTTIDASDSYAWDANTGWVTFRYNQFSFPSGTFPDGVVFGESYLSGYAYSANLGWISFGDGSPSNGYAYSNAFAIFQSLDYGVNHDSQGNLSGLAWSANTGWINFGWATATNAYRPRVDLSTGEFEGYAWGANTGWMNLGSGQLTTNSMTNTDSDSDGIADFWEYEQFGDLATAGQDTDYDSDGVSDRNEYLGSTDPDDANSYLKIVSQSYDQGITETTIEFTSSPTRLYRIEYSTDLGITDSWNNSTLGTFSPDSGVTTTRLITYTTDSENRCFFRVRAVKPFTTFTPIILPPFGL
ncbi:MAG: hypothetical protein ACSHX0_03340 [Akkermansiaceae bacterium]